MNLKEFSDAKNAQLGRRVRVDRNGGYRAADYATTYSPSRYKPRKVDQSRHYSATSCAIDAADNAAKHRGNTERANQSI